VIDAAALEQFQRQWATYQKLVDADELSHKAVGRLLHDTLIETFAVRRRASCSRIPRDSIVCSATTYRKGKPRPSGGRPGLAT
jgi:hypothetical protein